ncbi:TetR/AcrR family transcriptional regulator [Dysgonomonas sp. OttesenSCG-928-M03]|nr:TetR/AcrR family transcriptional regulator [Dysgonomonas sp. OttesenSCG-928-M03]
MENTGTEKDRELTKKKLLNALGDTIINEGFEKLGVNNIASKAGVSKVLIYRYFGSLDDMIIEYLSENDFWISFSIDFPDNENLRDFIKRIFRDQITQLRNNEVITKLQRWELTKKNIIIDKVRLKREANGMGLVAIISQLSKSPQEEIAAIATILSASISYLVLLSENCPLYNGIDIQSDKGWEQISKGIDQLIDLWYNGKSEVR